MKKTVFTLLIFMVCTIQALAYEYFTIYFSDGTKSEAFYASDVDSICYSKLSLDGIAFDEWQVQEIYTCDSVYRYPLAQIDSLSFKDVDVNKVAEDIARVNNLIVPLYLQCESISQLTEHLSTIQNSEEVEDAWTDNQSLFVKIRDYGTISFMYPPALVPLDAQYEGYRLPSKRAASQESNAHNHIDVQKVCVYNQTINDESSFFDAAAEACDIICRMNNVMGISCVPFTNLTPKFFQEEIFNYDQIFLITHGEYDQKHNLHWLLTSEELLCVEKENMLSNISAGAHLLTKYPFYSPYLIGCSAHKEIRNGKPCVVYYTKISEKFISASPNRFKQFGNAMVFNAACQSLKGNNNVAKAFIDKGAGCYIGYNETNDIGHGGAQEFCAGMLNGSSVQGSYNCIPSKWKEEIYEVNNACYPVELKIIKSSEKITNSCIVDIETLEPDKEYTNVKLLGRIKMLNTSVADNYKYGFQYSTNYEMSQPQNINAEGNHDNSTLYMNWEKTLDTSTLSPNTTYYYRAYMNDGYSDCYGEIKQFNTSRSEAYYIVYDDSIKYYYDEMYEQRRGSKLKIEKYYWLNYTLTKKVIFDSSFSNYYPTSFSFMGLERLEEIENIQYLRTDSIRDMSRMFSECRSLKSLDLSSFNTSNVTNMEGMFDHCSSLSSLDLSSFNTSNVTDMEYMFHVCSSLTSLDLSSFNTSNVTNMRGMFGGCSSLSSLDLSSFNTSNVTNMEGMFDHCSSLSSLDLSSFNTSKVMDMYCMFGNCSSLTNLNLSNFNTSNTVMGGMFEGCDALESLDISNSVLNGRRALAHIKNIKYIKLCNAKMSGDMSELFFGLGSLASLDLSNLDTSDVTDMHRVFGNCSSLTSLDLSSFNTSNVTNMRYMFDNCSSLTSLDLSSFNTSNVTNMRYMFDNCSSLMSLDLSSFNTSNVTEMGGMFYVCSSLTSLDLSSFNTSNVTNMAGMFYVCSSLTSLDLSSFNTSNVTNMRGMFGGCSSLSSLDLSSFNTSNVTDMGDMFNNCSSLMSLDLSSFNTSNVTNTHLMFAFCNSLKSIYAGNWNYSERNFDMFSGCYNLVGGMGTKRGYNLYGYNDDGKPLYYYCSSDGDAAHIDGGKDWPGLFTAK